MTLNLESFSYSTDKKVWAVNFKRFHADGNTVRNTIPFSHTWIRKYKCQINWRFSSEKKKCKKVRSQCLDGAQQSPFCHLLYNHVYCKPVGWFTGTCHSKLLRFAISYCHLMPFFVTAQPMTYKKLSKKCFLISSIFFHKCLSSYQFIIIWPSFLHPQFCKKT